MKYQPRYFYVLIIGLLVIALLWSNTPIVSGTTITPTSEIHLPKESVMSAYIQRVSISSSGLEGNGISVAPAISANGRYIAFVSAASNLINNDTNGFQDIFVHDAEIGQTTRVSIASDGTQGNGLTESPSISADGRYIAFTSNADNLVSSDTNGTWDVFVHDRQTGQTTRVSVASDGTQGNSHSTPTTISADGRYVGFSSLASNLVNGDTNGTWDIFVHDRQTGQTTRISVASDGTQGNTVSDPISAISADGRYIVFRSYASNLVSGDTNGVADVFVHEVQTGQTTRVSVASDGAQGNAHSYPSTVSTDGRYVAFTTSASNLVSGDTNGVSDAFIRDTQTKQTIRVSVTSDGGQGNSSSYAGAISADGRYIMFSSDADNLVSGDSNGVRDVFIRDRQIGNTTRISIASDGAQGNGNSSPYGVGSPSNITQNGRYIAFSSNASNLVSSDTNSTEDVFVVDLNSIVSKLPDTIGIYRPTTNTFYLRNSNSTGFSDINVSLVSLGMDPITFRDVPVVGDWNGDGIDTVGFYRRGRVSDNAGAGLFVLSDSNSSPQADYSFVLGNPSDTPIVGDWDGDGKDGVGVFRPSNGLIYIKNNLTTGFADYTMVLGNPGDVGIAGDWDNDGRDSPGVYRPGAAPQFYLTNQVCNCVVASDYNVTFGNPNDQPFTGDWNGDGRTGVGVYRTSNGITYLRNDPTTTGFSDFNFVYGVNGDYAFGGVWAAATPPAQIEIAPPFQP